MIQLTTSEKILSETEILPNNEQFIKIVMINCHFNTRHGIIMLIFGFFPVYWEKWGLDDKAMLIFCNPRFICFVIYVIYLVSLL